MELTLKEAAAHVDLSERQLQRHMYAGHFASRLVDGKRLIDVESLEAYMNRPRKGDFIPVPAQVAHEKLLAEIRQIVREEIAKAFS